MNNCGWALPTPETKTYSKTTRARNLPVRRRNKTAVRELAKRTFDEQLFEAYLCNYSALSQTEHEPQGGEPLLKRLCGESNKQSFLLNTALVLAITNRAENLRYQFKQGQKLTPQFRQIICLVACFARRWKTEVLNLPYVILREQSDRENQA